jgi:hypothetical protein
MSANVEPVPRTVELNGLNWQVQVDPVTLSITTLPPTLPVLAAVDELWDDFPPQAATSKHATATGISQLKRFIDTLRSPFEIASSSLAENLCARTSRRAIWEMPKQKQYIAVVIAVQARRDWGFLFQFPGDPSSSLTTASRDPYRNPTAAAPTRDRG